MPFQIMSYILFLYNYILWWTFTFWPCRICIWFCWYRLIITIKNNICITIIFSNISQICFWNSLNFIPFHQQTWYINSPLSSTYLILACFGWIVAFSVSKTFLKGALSGFLMSWFLIEDSDWWVNLKSKNCLIFSSLSAIAASHVRSNVGLIKNAFFSSVLVTLLVKDTNGTNRFFFLIFISVNFES